MPPLASLADWKTISDVASNVVTVAAIGLGGAWAYWRFVRERTRWPRAELELVVTHRRLTEEQTLLNATVKIRNAGAGLMKLSGIRAYIYRILPLDAETEGRLTDPEFVSEENGGDWPCIGSQYPRWPEGREPEVEPQEHDEYGWDFIVPTSTETVFVYVYVTNVKKRSASRELGWQVTAFYDLVQTGGERRVSNVAIGEDMPGQRGPRHEQQPPREEPRREKQEKQREPRPDPIRKPQREPRPDPPPPPPSPDEQRAPREDPRRD